MRNILRYKMLTLMLGTLLFAGAVPTVFANNFNIDPTHSFIQFRISHLGFSILNGRFNELKGHFYYDESQSAKTSFQIEVNTASVDTNHAERDKHLRNEEFLDVKKYPQAKFESIIFKEEGMSATLTGKLQLHGVTRNIEVYVQRLGAGDDPWGGYRQGFKGQTSIRLKDFGINYNLGPAAEELRLDVYIEGIRAK